MDNESSPILLEFVGIPGSGKSKTSHRVVETLRSQQQRPFWEPTYTISKYSRWSFRQAAKVPYIGYGGVHKQAVARQYISQKGLSLNPVLLFNWLFVRGVVEWSVHRNHDTALDQGLIQALWSFRLSEPEDTVAFFRQRLLEIYPRIRSLIVCVEVSSQTAEVRLAQRGDNRSRVGTGLDASFNTEEAQSAYRYIKDIVYELVDSRPEVAMLTLRNDDQSDLRSSVESVIQEMKTQILSI